MFNGIEEVRRETVRSVALLCAAAAVTAPKSGGQLLARGKPLFVETAFVDEPDTLKRLADWLRQRGAERRQEIWFRDAAVAERIDGVLFIGLKDWYPPIYDCGACGYATCAAGPILAGFLIAQFSFGRSFDAIAILMVAAAIALAFGARNGSAAHRSK